MRSDPRARLRKLARRYGRIKLERTTPNHKGLNNEDGPGNDPLAAS